MVKVVKDIDEAVRWYRKSSDLGNKHDNIV
jgi:TPR repeat protein